MTVEAGGAGEAGSAGGADAAGFEGVEAGVAPVAGPVEAERRGGVAAGTGESLTAGKAFEFAEGSGLFEAAPAVHGGVGGNEAGPYGPEIDGEDEQSSHAEKAKEGRDHEAAGAAEREPEERAQDLAAVEGVDGKDIEDEEDDIGGEDGPEQAVFVGHGVAPMRGSCKGEGRGEDWEQGDIDEGAGGDAPQGGAGALGRVNIGYAAEGPEEDGIGFAADGAAGEGMAEFVQKNDGEEGQIFEDVPEDGGVGAVAGLDFVCSDQEPGPVEIDGDTGNTKDAKRTLAAEHEGSLAE